MVVYVDLLRKKHWPWVNEVEWEVYSTMYGSAAICYARSSQVPVAVKRVFFAVIYIFY